MVVGRGFWFLLFGFWFLVVVVVGFWLLYPARMIPYKM